MPDPVIIENRPLRACLMALLWLAETGFGVLVAATGGRWLGPTENGAAVLAIGAGAIAVAAGVVMALIAGRAACLKGAAIEMTAEGFRDRRLSDRLVPWPAMDWKVVFNGSAYSLHFDLAAEARRHYRVGLANHAVCLFNRAFRYPEFTVLTLGTAKSAHQIAKLMDRFRPG